MKLPALLLLTFLSFGLFAQPMVSDLEFIGPPSPKNTLCFETKSDLYAHSGSENAPAILMGESVAGDVPLRMYWFNLASTASDDGESVIKPTAVSANGRWIKASWASTAIQANWTQASSGDPSYIQNKPVNATTSVSGFMSSTDKAKLDGIAAGATANSADAFLLSRANHTGTQAVATITGLAAVATSNAYSDLSGKPVNATTSVAGLMSSADKTKLDGIAAGATANSSDATLLNRANHTGSQAISTVTGLQTALDGKLSTTPTVSYPSRSFNTSYQNTGAISFLTWGVKVVCSITVLAAQSGYAALEVSPNNSTWTEVCRVENGTTLLGLFTNTGAGPLTAFIPAGSYYRVTTSGNATITTTSNPQLVQW